MREGGDNSRNPFYLRLKLDVNGYIRGTGSMESKWVNQLIRGCEYFGKGRLGYISIDGQGEGKWVNSVNWKRGYLNNIGRGHI